MRVKKRKTFAGSCQGTQGRPRDMFTETIQKAPIMNGENMLNATIIVSTLDPFIKRNHQRDPLSSYPELPATLGLFLPV